LDSPEEIVHAGGRLAHGRAPGHQLSPVTAAASPRPGASPKSLALNAGAVDHYQDPTNYDRLYGARTEDRDFYLRRAQGMRSILEYGAGNGRLTLPLLVAGKQVCAVDVSRAMLDALSARVEALPGSARKRLESHLADMRTFSTRRRFDQVIVGFHALGHLYSHSDVATFFERAHRHLLPDGELLLDLPLPNLDLPGYDGAAQVMVSEMDGAGGPELLTLRLFQPQELCMHLHYAGFERVRLYGDFEGGALEADSEVMVLSARKPKC